jgi:dienelactone hydrolase
MAMSTTPKMSAPDATTMKPGTNTPFGALKQVDAGLLSVGYAEAGPPDGPAVILLHGWPYDIHSYADVTPLLASAGYRVIVPYLCAATAPPASFQMRRTGMASNRSSGSTSSRSWISSASTWRS